MENEIIEWVKNSLYSYLGTKMCERSANQISNIWKTIKSKFTNDEEIKLIQQIEGKPNSDYNKKGFEYFLKKKIQEDKSFALELYDGIKKQNSNRYNSEEKYNEIHITGNNNNVKSIIH